MLGGILLALLGVFALWPPPPASAPAYSNILPGDYVGPAVCAECHEDKRKLWLTHPHSRMNQLVTTATVKGDFANARVDYAGSTFVFGRAGGRFTMEEQRGGKPLRSFTMVLTVGSTFQQMYIGMQTAGPEPRDSALYHNQLKMPFGYWFQLGRWLPVAYFDTDPFPPEYDAQGRFSHDTREPLKYTHWQPNCARCHNTYPYENTLVSGGARAGFPLADVNLTATLAEPAQFERARRGLLLLSDLVTTGVSCESCHFGGREHAKNQQPPRFVPQGERLEFPKATPELIAGARKNPYVINAICAQCHSAHVAVFANGAGVINSREASDLLAGACVSKLHCVHCHEPHTPLPPPAKRDLPARFEAEAARCLPCHAAYADPARRRQHQGHAPAAGVTCLDCHMPRISQGLEAVVHSHRISLPVEASMVAAGHPNACNLCHLDRSLAWTLEQLSKLWGKTLAKSPDWARLYGEHLEKPVGEVWATHKQSIVRLVAADAHSREHAVGRSPKEVLRVLDDPHAVNRVFGLLALQHLLGRKVSQAEYDPLEPSAVRTRQAADLVRLLPAR